MKKANPITNKIVTTRASALKKTPPTLGEQDVRDASGNLLRANDAATAGTEGTPSKTETVNKPLPSYKEAYKGVDKEKYPTLQSFIDAAENFKKDNPEKFKAMSTETKVTPGTPGTDGERTTEYKPVLTEERKADKVDTFLPWERNWAQRTQRGAVRDEKKRGRKAKRDLQKALNQGYYSEENGNMDEYRERLADANKRALGQGPIATAQYQNDNAMASIASQGYQANPAVSTQTDYMRNPQAGQKGGQPVKASGNEMTQEDYENYGKDKSTDAVKTDKPVTSEKSTQGEPKTSSELPELSTADLSVQSRLFDRDGDPSGEEVPEFEPIKGKSKSSDMFNGDLRELDGLDVGAPMGSEGPAKPTPKQPKPETPKSPKSPAGPMGGKGVETDNLDDLVPNDPIAQADKEFGSDGVVVKDGAGTVGGKGVETDDLSDVKSSLSVPSESDLSDGIPTASGSGSVVSVDKPTVSNSSQADAMNDALESALAEDKTAFKKRGYKMNRMHNPSMLYNKNAPTRKMGSPLNKLTDLSGDGKVTRKDVLIGRGVLDQDGSPLNKFANDAQRKAVWASKNEKKASAAKYKPTAFKMKGFGSKNKK